MWPTFLPRRRDAGSQRPTAARQPAPLRRAPGRLRVQQLEDRTVPSTFVVNTTADTVDANPGDGKALDASGHTSLRAAIMEANADPGADAIRFTPKAWGTITLDKGLGQLGITDDLKIYGPGTGLVTVSGGDAVRVFDIASGVSAAISGLTIAHGVADKTALGIQSAGGGILNRGNLTLDSVVVSDNRAVGDATANPDGRGFGSAFGGGVYNRTPGTLTVSDSTFTRNQALGGSGSTGAPLPGGAAGGALANTGVVTVTDSRFTDNLAQGGDNNNSTTAAGIAGVGAGGAIANTGFFATTTLDVSGSTFTDNRAVGGSDNNPGPNVLGRLAGFGVGGAIFSQRFSFAVVVHVQDSTFDHNTAQGGNRNQVSATDFVSGPNYAAGGGVFIADSKDPATPTSTISNSRFAYNQALGGQGQVGKDGGQAHGGGIGIGFTGTKVEVSHVTVEHNLAVGGQAGTSGNGGDALGGGIYNEAGAVLTVDHSLIGYNEARGGDGGETGTGGRGIGGGIDNVSDATRASNLTVSSSALIGNQAVGGRGRTGGAADGGGINNEGASGQTAVATVTSSTFAGNQAIGGTGSSDGGNAYGGGISNLAFSQLDVTDSFILLNVAVGGVGGDGGDGLGGGIFNDGTATLTDSVVALNTARGGDGGTGGAGGDGQGGGVYNDAGATMTATDSLIVFNRARGGEGDGTGSDGVGTGGGVYNAGAFDAPGTLIAFNAADLEPDRHG